MTTMSKSEAVSGADDRGVLAVMSEIDALAESTGTNKEDVAEAFLAVRSECESNEQALELLRSVGRHRTANAVARKGGSVVVRGGEGSRLAPMRELDGTPDPEIARMVGEGAARYHLETLRQLADDDQELLAERVAPPPMPPGSTAFQFHATAAVAAGDFAATPRRRTTNAERPCRSAACRTLIDCLCTCRCCRKGCASRRRGLPTSPPAPVRA